MKFFTEISLTVLNAALTLSLWPVLSPGSSDLCLSCFLPNSQNHYLQMTNLAQETLVS